MGFGEQLRFMFTTLHSGAVNLTLHLASIPVLLVELARCQVGWIVVGALMEVAGARLQHGLPLRPVGTTTVGTVT